MCASNTYKHVYILEGQISFYNQLHAMWVKIEWKKEGCISHWPPLLQTLQQSLRLIALRRCLVQRVCNRICLPSTRCDWGEMQMCHGPSGTSSRERSKYVGDGSSSSPELQHIVQSKSKFCRLASLSKEASIHLLHLGQAPAEDEIGWMYMSMSDLVTRRFIWYLDGREKQTLRTRFILL